jgi:hypothetical protein
VHVSDPANLARRADLQQAYAPRRSAPTW